MASETPQRLADLIEAGSNRYVAWLLDRGYSYSGAYARLRERFNLASGSTLWAAVGHGSRAYDMGRRIAASDPGDVIGAGEMPTIVAGCTRYEYVGEVFFRAPGSSEIQARQMMTVSTSPLSRGEVEQGWAERVSEGEAGSPKRVPAQSEYVRSEWLSASRACP